MSAFAAIKDGKAHPEKYKGRPKLPAYKRKDGFPLLILTNQNCRLRDGYMQFPRVFGGFYVKPVFTKQENAVFPQVRFVPCGDSIMMEIIYELPDVPQKQDNGTANKFGRYIMQLEYHANAVTCAMFLTAMAGNPMAAALAGKTVGVEISWSGWFAAAVVPGLVSLIILPYLIYKICPPELHEMPHAKKIAEDELNRMGPMTSMEKIVAGVFVGALILWASSSLTHMDATGVGMLAVMILILTKVLTWQDILQEKGAWNTMFWMGALIALAGALSSSGFIGAVAEMTGAAIQSAGLSWGMAFILFILIYVYSHYAFASISAHIGAMYAAFLAVAVSVGATAMLAAIVFGAFSNLMSSLTHYGGSPAPILYGAGYVPQGTWWKVGFIVTTTNIVIWLGIGLPWWHLLGLF